MSETVRLELVEERMISNPEALRLLEQALSEIVSKGGTPSQLLMRTLNYLKKFSKVPPEKAPELYDELLRQGLKASTAVMIINVCPQSVDDLRLLLEGEERIFDSEFMNDILNKVKLYCHH
ncbi:MAG: RNA polymerase Rpb4 family protein [Desulfurococcaceae archaeon]